MQDKAEYDKLWSEEVKKSTPPASPRTNREIWLLVSSMGHVAAQGGLHLEASLPSVVRNQIKGLDMSDV
jgi:hypothetical protein